MKVLNNNSIRLSSDTLIDKDNLKNIDTFIMDHDYIGINSEYAVSQFTKEVIIYISGFVVYKLTNILKCETCKIALVSVEKDCFLKSLISLKNEGGNKGGLMYPNEDVISICFKIEHFLKMYNYKQKAINKLQVQTKVLAHYLHVSNIFKYLKRHSQESSSPLIDHITLLMKSIAITYMNVKINYSLKTHNETPSLRQ